MPDGAVPTKNGPDFQIRHDYDPNAQVQEEEEETEDEEDSVQGDDQDNQEPAAKRPRIEAKMPEQMFKKENLDPGEDFPEQLDNLESDWPPPDIEKTMETVTEGDKGCDHCSYRYNQERQLLRHMLDSPRCKSEYGFRYEEILFTGMQTENGIMVLNYLRDRTMENTANVKTEPYSLLSNPQPTSRLNASNQSEAPLYDCYRASLFFPTYESYEEICRGCKKVFVGLKALLAHASRAKNCKSSYGEEFDSLKRVARFMSKLECKGKASRERQTGQQQALAVEKVEYSNEDDFEQSQQDIVVSKKKAYYEENREEILEKKRLYKQAKKQEAASSRS